jgi:hypothetical protein
MAQNSPTPFYIFINGDSGENKENGNSKSIANSSQTAQVNGNCLKYSKYILFGVLLSINKRSFSLIDSSDPDFQQR